MSLTHEEMLFTLGVVDAGFLSAAGGDATLTDATKNWPTNGLAGMAVRVFSGTGNGQWRVVASNTATVITVASNWGTNPVAGDRYVILATGSSTVSMAAAAASLAVLDDWDETDRAKVNIIAGQAGVAAGEGASGVTVQRMVLASDLLSATIACGADAQTAVVAAGGASTQIWVYGYSVGAVALASFVLESANTDKEGPFWCGANGGRVRDRESPIFKCATNEALNCTTTTGAVQVSVTYKVIAV